MIVSGKLRAQRAKSMKFKDGYMISSGQPVNEYIDSAVRHVLLRQVCVQSFWWIYRENSGLVTFIGQILEALCKLGFSAVFGSVWLRDLWCKLTKEKENDREIKKITRYSNSIIFLTFALPFSISLTDPRSKQSFSFFTFQILMILLLFSWRGYLV